MSAFICDDYHISVLAAYIAPLSIYHDGLWITLSEPEEIGAILYGENLRSVNYRYREQESGSFTFDKMALNNVHLYKAVEIIKAANCFDYQACETDDYKDTVAAKIINEIIAHAVRRIPGYEDAEWGIRTIDNPPVLLSLTFR